MVEFARRCLVTDSVVLMSQSAIVRNWPQRDRFEMGANLCGSRGTPSATVSGWSGRWSLLPYWPDPMARSHRLIERSRDDSDWKSSVDIGAMDGC